MWSEKHRPLALSGMVGNEEARSEAAGWLDNWKRGDKPLLLTGPPGTGKTTIARILADIHGYDMVELNASDARSKSRINQIIPPALASTGLSGRTMIFVDEVDGIHGRSDYGGAEALIRLLKDAPAPIMLAANDSDAGKMRDILKACRHVRFRPVPPRLLRVYLQGVLRKEGASVGPGTVIRVVAESRGDIRSMLNLAQSLATGFSPETERPVQEAGAEEGVEAFFKAKSPSEAASVLYSMQMDPREKMNAFYSAVVSSRVDGRQLSRMLEVLSRADLLHGRIMATQNWRLLRYLNPILSELYREGLPVRYTRYNLPFPLLTRIRFDGRKLRELNAFMGRGLRMSGSAFAAIGLPFYLVLVRAGKVGVPERFAEIVAKEASSSR